MHIVTIRRVGNSSVVALPRQIADAGYTAGVSVVLEHTSSGKVVVMPEDWFRGRVQETARRVISEHQEALELLALYDRGKATPDYVKERSAPIIDDGVELPMSGSRRNIVDFVTDDLLSIYARLFSLTYHQATDHLRHQATLEGAVGRPRQHAHDAHVDLTDRAAVLGHGIAERQPVVTGNKRTAVIPLITLLLINSVTIIRDDNGIGGQRQRLSAGLTDDELESRVRTSLVPRSG